MTMKKQLWKDFDLDEFFRETDRVAKFYKKV